MKKFLILLSAFIYFSANSQDIDAQTNGLNYQNYAAGGAQPSYTQDANGNITNRTLLSTGTVNTVGLTTSSGAGLPTRSDGFIVRFYGFINIPTAGTYSFGGQADDGIRIKINNVFVVNSWIESGGDFRSGSINLPAGVVPVEIMYYENSGGQMVNFWWFINGSWQIVPSTALATAASFFTPPAPVLCCGGSSASFTTNTTNATNVINFQNRTTSDSQVYIEQVGNQNTIEIQQTGTKGNYAKYYGNGTSNDISIVQSSTVTTATNYTDVSVVGNSNMVDIRQQSTGGTKGAFVTINNNNNSLLLTQKDSGSHYTEVNLAGGNKNVDILQQGSGNHMARIGLSGLPVDLSLTQSGSTQNFYSINFNCATTGGCAKITVQQGQ